MLPISSSCERLDIFSINKLESLTFIPACQPAGPDAAGSESVPPQRLMFLLQQDSDPDLHGCCQRHRHHLVAMPETNCGS